MPEVLPLPVRSRRESITLMNRLTRRQRNFGMLFQESLLLEPVKDVSISVLDILTLPCILVIIAEEQIQKITIMSI
jgi:hypothetical protein